MTESLVDITYFLSGPTRRFLLQRQIERTKQHYEEARVKTLKDTYVEPLSCREDWWRCQLRETPVPGAYEIDEYFIEDGKKTPQPSHFFRSEGRKRDIMKQGRGDWLMPGEFTPRDFLQDLRKRKITYSFKNTGRDKFSFTQTSDKAINICPNKYPMEKYLSMTAERTPSKHMVFRSQVQRSIHKPVTDLPPVGTYDPPQTSRPRPLSSMFRSRTPRFRTAHTKVPGPGSYDKTYQSPMPATIARMGRQHGLFFQCSFQP